MGDIFLCDANSDRILLNVCMTNGQYLRQTAMQKAKLSSENLCSVIENNRSELYPDYRSAGYIVARLDEDAVFAVKGFRYEGASGRGGSKGKRILLFPILPGMENRRDVADHGRGIRL